jgi:hypothetical protein
VVINKALVIDAGAGNDWVRFIGVALFSLQIGTQCVVNLGDGHDRFNGAFTHTASDHIIHGGAGNDEILLQASTGRDVAIHAEEGFDGVSVLGVQMTNSLLVDGGSEADRIELRFVNVANDSAVFGRSGGDAIFVKSTRAARTFLVNGGADFGYIEIHEQSSFDGNTYLINEGPGQINVLICRFNRLEIITGPNGDSASISRCVVEELFASLGEASDACILVQSRVNRRVRLDGQGGFDLVAQGGNVLTNLEVVGFEFFPSPQSFAPQLA